MYILAPTLLAQLYDEVTPKYAHKWEVIGTKLGLLKGRLEAIKTEWPTNFKRCCNRMLDEWVDVDINACMEKINAVIQSLEVHDIEASPNNEGDLAILYSYIIKLCS